MKQNVIEEGKYLSFSLTLLIFSLHAFVLGWAPLSDLGLKKICVHVKDFNGQDIYIAFTMEWKGNKHTNCLFVGCSFPWLQSTELLISTVLQNAVEYRTSDLQLRKSKGSTRKQGSKI
jgi:hypothetical protein